MQIRQTGSLSDYQEEFERLHNKVYGWSQEALVGAFMNGLHYSLANGIRMFQPKSLREVINYARLMDGQLQRQQKEFRKPIVSARPFTPSSTPTSGNRNRDEPTQTPKKLSWDELRRKRSLGLCFSCDERYTPGHKCKKPQLLLMEGGDEKEEDNASGEDAEEEPEITLNALTCWDAPKTLRV